MIPAVQLVPERLVGREVDLSGAKSNGGPQEGRRGGRKEEEPIGRELHRYLLSTSAADSLAGWGGEPRAERERAPVK